MSKRIIALLLCAFMLIPCFASCAKKDDDDVGAYITMYLTSDTFDFDPANAYYNKDSLNIVGLLFDTLFTLDKDGNVKESLVEEYKIVEDPTKNEYTMELILNETCWSNGTQLSADDVVFAWKRLVNSNNNFAAASLLYDIKNARAIKEGDVSIDDLGVEAVAINVVKITFEGPIDYDQFLLNLTSVATAPLYENYVTKNADWAKKPSTMVTSGAYKIGKINYKDVTEPLLNSKGEVVEGQEIEVKVEDDYAFDEGYYGLEEDVEKGTIGSGSYVRKKINFFYLERNVYYYRDTERDSIDESVTNYRILVDCSMTEAQLLEEYKAGRIFYVGNIPLSLRGDAFVKENVQTTNALSTFVLYMNENALINDGGDGSKLFADANVRNALSLAIDRQAIAEAVVYAKAATGLVCPGVFETNNKKKEFRTEGGDLIATSKNIAKAQELLTAAGITPSKYTFTVKVAGNDEVNVAITKMIVAAWQELGFNVTMEEIFVITNNDYYKETASVPNDVCDDLFIESIQRNKYEVIAFDYNAFSADAYSMLSNFANSFSGMALQLVDGEYALTPNSTGYTSQEYNDLMEAIYYIPYFASLTEESSSFLGLYDTAEEFKTLYNKIKAIYEANGITPTTKASEWTKQKSILLHKAEEVLLKDMPVIPVVFNENAVLVSDELTKVSSTYYIPAYFRKTNLKDYQDYVPVLEGFPAVDWSKKGYVEPEETK